MTNFKCRDTQIIGLQQDFLGMFLMKYVGMYLGMFKELNHLKKFQVFCQKVESGLGSGSGSK
jgi:hypothetical protein